MNKEQEQYFDRKILGKIEGAEVDAPLSWAEMEGQLNKQKRSGGWWLRGFLFSDVVLLLASSLLIWQWSSMDASKVTTDEAVSMKVQLPELVVADKANDSQESIKNRATFSASPENESATAATITASSTSTLATTTTTTTTTTTNTTSTTTTTSSSAASLSSNVDVRSSKVSSSSAGEKTSGVLRKKSGRKSSVGSFTPDGRSAAIIREADGEVAVVDNAEEKSSAIPVSALVPVFDPSIPSKTEKNVSEGLTNSSVARQIFTESSSNDWQLMSVLGGMAELSPLELSLLVPDKKSVVQHKDELSPALISVYGIGGFEKVKYSTLVPKGEELNFQHQWHGGTGFGLTFGYMTNANWSMHIGLEYMRREMEFEWISPAKRQDFYLDSTYVQIIPPVGPPYYVWQFDTVYTTVSYVDSLNYRASVSVVTVPVLIQYAKPMGAFTIAPYSGVEWSSRTTTKLIREREGESPSARNEGNLKETRNYMSLRAGCKVFLRLGVNADLFTGVDFRYMLPLNRDRLKGVSGSLQLGIQLHR